MCEAAAQVVVERLRVHRPLDRLHHRGDLAARLVRQLCRAAGVGHRRQTANAVRDPRFVVLEDHRGAASGLPLSDAVERIVGEHDSIGADLRVQDARFAVERVIRRRGDGPGGQSRGRQSSQGIVAIGGRLAGGIHDGGDLLAGVEVLRRRVAVGVDDPLEVRPVRAGRDLAVGRGERADAPRRVVGCGRVHGRLTAEVWRRYGVRASGAILQRVRADELPPIPGRHDRVDKSGPVEVLRPRDAPRAVDLGDGLIVLAPVRIAVVRVIVVGGTTIRARLLRLPPEHVIDDRRDAPIRVGDRGDEAVRVVAALHDMAERVCHLRRVRPEGSVVLGRGDTREAVARGWLGHGRDVSVGVVGHGRRDPGIRGVEPVALRADDVPGPGVLHPAERRAAARRRHLEDATEDPVVLIIGVLRGDRDRRQVVGRLGLHGRVARAHARDCLVAGRRRLRESSRPELVRGDGRGTLASELRSGARVDYLIGMGRAADQARACPGVDLCRKSLGATVLRVVRHRRLQCLVIDGFHPRKPEIALIRLVTRQEPLIAIFVVAGEGAAPSVVCRHFGHERLRRCERDPRRGGPRHDRVRDPRRRRVFHNHRAAEAVVDPRHQVRGTAARIVDVVRLGTAVVEDIREVHLAVAVVVSRDEEGSLRPVGPTLPPPTIRSPHHRCEAIAGGFGQCEGLSAV